LYLRVAILAKKCPNVNTKKLILMIVNTLKFTDSDFPNVLANISSPPQQLFWTGQDPKVWLNKPRVAIVGSRKLTPYGRGVTDKLASKLAQAGVVIISGLAYGIDITAHKAALASGGITVAVLPSSLDFIYPTSHYDVARQILVNGSLISEYPQGEAIAFKSNFIARNRLISGLAEVLLITEAAVNSGSLHTARFALEQGRTVMAVPGNITSSSSDGCNNLIKSGAVPVTSAEDVFFALKINPKKTRTHRKFDGPYEEKIILQLLKNGLCAQEEIVQAAELDSSTVAGALTMLEISGYIRPAGNGNWLVA
jgi:DNA processing protein